MLQFRHYILTSLAFFSACQNSCGFKNLVKFGTRQANFKITLCRSVFNLSWSTSRKHNRGAPFHRKFSSKWLKSERSSQRASPGKSVRMMIRTKLNVTIIVQLFNSISESFYHFKIVLCLQYLCLTKYNKLYCAFGVSIMPKKFFFTSTVQYF